MNRLNQVKPNKDMLSDKMFVIKWPWVGLSNKSGYAVNAAHVYEEMRYKLLRGDAKIIGMLQIAIPVSAYFLMGALFTPLGWMDLAMFTAFVLVTMLLQTMKMKRWFDKLMQRIPESGMVIQGMTVLTRPEQRKP